MSDTFDLGVDGLLTIPPPHETAFRVAAAARKARDQQRLLALAERDIFAETVAATGVTP